jgi:sugar (pentulose or hexulose) kinase
VNYAIAVIDIGMTNKKVAVYDDALRQIDAHYRQFDPVMADGKTAAGMECANLPCHDLVGMETWFLDELGSFAKRYPVKAIAVTVHGATFVCVGKDGKPALPCVYYTHEPGETFHERFYAAFGKAEALQERTGTPAFKAMINPAKGLFFAREVFPEAFASTAIILPYPQYWGFRLSGKAGAESTYMGCHTYLWDQIDQRLSSVARDMAVAPLMPAELKKSWDVLGTVSAETAAATGLSPDTIVTMGIHDSNSSLLPHFAKKGGGGFVLNSTGTWCVMMNPVERYGFAPDELGKVVFFNISAFGKPVKTAIFLGGQEFETWSKLIMEHNGRSDFPPWDEALYRTILKEKRVFLLPEITPGSGQYPRSKARISEDGTDYPFETTAGRTPPCFAAYEEAFAVLRISLVMQTLTALERIGLARGAEIYTEGGFRKNEAYNRLLSSAFAENRVFLTDIAEATALGAAMTAKIALTGKDLSELAGDFNVEYREVEKSNFPELASYREAWNKLTEG